MLRGRGDVGCPRMLIQSETKLLLRLLVVVAVLPPQLQTFSPSVGGYSFAGPSHTCRRAGEIAMVPGPMENVGARQTVWDNPQFTAARCMNYRRDLLPIEKSVGLTGVCTYKEAWAAVHDGRVLVDGAPAKLGDLVGQNQTVALDGRELPQREPIVCYLLNKPRQVMCTCQVCDSANLLLRQNRISCRAAPCTNMPSQ